MTSYPNRIEEFTKEQTISYLAQYPNSLKAEALRRNLLESLKLSEIEAMLKEENPCIPKGILEKQAISLRQNLSGLLNRSNPNEVKSQKNKPHTPKATSSERQEKTISPKPKPTKKVNVTTATSTKNNSNGGSQKASNDTMSKIILTILVIGIAIGIVILLDAIDINMDTLWIKIPFCVGGAALLKMIWN